MDVAVLVAVVPREFVVDRNHVATGLVIGDVHAKAHGVLRVPRRVLCAQLTATAIVHAGWIGCALG